MSENTPDRTLKAYAHRLANLSGQNKALLFMRPSAQQDLDLLDLDYASGKPALTVLEQLVEGKQKIVLCSTGLEGGKDAELSQRLKNIARKAQSVAEETGSQDLHLGWPLATGRWGNDALVRAPLLLFPVRIWMQAGTWYLSPQEGEGPAFNKAFLLGMAHYNQAALPDELLEEDFSDAPEDFLAFRTWLYERLKTAELPLHFNQELFHEPLKPLRSFRKDELEKETKTGFIKLMPEAVLGLFPQADSFMGGDYERFDELGITLEQILNRRASAFDTEYPSWPLAVDGSQEVLLQRLRQGESLTVQGPPGTGKSQLIANLTADALAAGRRVLVVCQKRAALEVVQNRLSEVGLGSWLAPVHDFRADRPALFERISGQIAALAEFGARAATVRQGASPEAFSRTALRLAETDAELEALRQALFLPGSSGASARDLYLAQDPAAPRADLGDLYLHFPLPQAEAFSQKLARLDVIRNSLRGIPAFWNARRSLHAAGPADEEALVELLNTWATQGKNLTDAAAKPKVSPKEARRWMVRMSRPGFIPGLQKSVQACGNPEVAELAQLLCARKQRRLVKKLSRKVRALRRNRPYADALAQAKIDTALRQMVRADTKGLLKCLDEAAEAEAKGSVAWLSYRLFGPGSQAVVALASGKGSRAERLAKTREQLQASIRLASFRKGILSRMPVLQAYLPSEPSDTAGWQKGLDTLALALTVARFFHKARLGRAVQKLFFTDAHTRKAYVTRVAAIGADLARWGSQARTRLSTAQLQAVLENKVDIPKAVAGLRQHFDTLVECDRITHALSLPERGVLERLLAARPALTQAGSVAALFRSSLLAAWIDRTERENPVLRLAAGPVLDMRRAEVLSALEDRRNLASGQVLLRLFAEAERAAGDTRQLKELAHQVRKKRQIWSVRRLLETYFEQASRLLPCWLASPETVSAILPFSEGLFDLVIFDEASQCFAERGIPAAWRGSQLLITGDSRQLPPFDLYRIRYQNEDDSESADTEAVSLLDLAALYLPEAGLESHYRSRHPELIEFSNRHFYRGRLQALPQREAVLEGIPPITVTRIAEGLWQNRQNLPEAKTVVQALLHHLRTAPDETVGVVTFNQPQQQLILDLLDEAVQEQQILLPPTLFVKNIENVQGDERDRIFFSLGYGPDEQGKIRLQFGSLSTQGGENRLNVAITRARLGVRLFTSLAAADLGKAATGAPGARLLADYLAYAEEVSQGSLAYEVLETPTPPAGSLAARLTAREQGLSPAFPFADLTRFTEAVPTGLVFTDDAGLQTAPSAREYLIVRPAHAARLGWATEQRWSRGELRR